MDLSLLCLEPVLAPVVAGLTVFGLGVGGNIEIPLPELCAIAEGVAAQQRYKNDCSRGSCIAPC